MTHDMHRNPAARRIVAVARGVVEFPWQGNTAFRSACLGDMLLAANFDRQRREDNC